MSHCGSPADGWFENAYKSPKSKSPWNPSCRHPRSTLHILARIACAKSSQSCSFASGPALILKRPAHLRRHHSPAPPAHAKARFARRTSRAGRNQKTALLQGTYPAHTSKLRRNQERSIPQPRHHPPQPGKLRQRSKQGITPRRTTHLHRPRTLKRRHHRQHRRHILRSGAMPGPLRTATQRNQIGEAIRKQTTTDAFGPPNLCPHTVT